MSFRVSLTMLLTCHVFTSFVTFLNHVIGTDRRCIFLQGRMILAHLCDEPKGLKTGMCMVCIIMNIDEFQSYLVTSICCVRYISASLKFLSKQLIFHFLTTMTILCSPFWSSHLPLQMHSLQNCSMGRLLLLLLFFSC